jgi:membrane-associated phospholipid phosphatase
MIVMTYNIVAESMYSYDLKKDIAIGAVSLGIFISPFFIDSSPKDISFQKDDVNPFDRSMMFSYNRTLDTFSDLSAYGLLVLPAISVIGNIKDVNALVTYGIMYAEAFLLTYGTKDLFKNAISRNRPYTYSGSIPSGKEDDYYKSFPSGSTSLAFMSAGFLSSTFFTEYPDSPWKIPVIGISYSLALGIGVSRILSGAHFMTDVMTGAVIGSLYGYLIPLLHLRKNERSKIAFMPVLNGFIVSYQF